MYIVSKIGSPSSSDFSYKEAALDVGNEFTIDNFGEEDLTVTIKFLSVSGSDAEVEVEVLGEYT